MQKMSFWNRRKNNADTKALSNALTDSQDKAWLKGSIEKNELAPKKTDPNTEYKYINDNDDEQEGQGGQPSLQEGLGMMSKIKGFFGNSGGGGGFSFGGGGAAAGAEAGAGASGGAGGGAPWGAIAGVARQGYDTIMDKDGKDYSDLEQTTIYPLQGAAIGGSYGGGWGALGGALYGLGYSFKDDIGLKDNDTLTTILFPIGMGDEHEGLIQL